MSTPDTIQDLRALEQFSVIPAGHTGIPVLNNRFAPHLRPGEIAVVNLDDKEPVSGELFVIGINDKYGERQPRIVQTMVHEEDSYKDGVWSTYMSCWDRFAFKHPGMMTLADGPMTAENWREHRCMGRIVGFVAPDWDLTPYRGDAFRLGE